MGIIKNVVETVFTSKGASAVTKETESLGRAQTRLGQSSAASGRSFAAQSQGLGGFVAAYAGAAATVFALEAAFGALSKSAQAATIVKGTNALAAAVGQSGPTILKTITDLTQSQLTLAEAAQSVNIALSAGFNTTQIEGLTRVAVKASRALGRDMSDAFQRLVRGTAKLEPELLDELGIFTRIDPAIKAYAREMGVAANSLSDFEKRQAFANAAIAEGTRKFSSISTSGDSAQKSFEQLKTSVYNMAIEFGQFMSTTIKPLVDFFAKDAGNAILLFSGIIFMVFHKATSMIGGFFTSTVIGVTTWADAIVMNDTKVIASMEKVKLAASQMNVAIASRGGVYGKKDYVDPVSNTAYLAGSGRLNNKSLLNVGATPLTNAETAAATAARNAFLSKQTLNRQQMQGAVSALTVVTTKLRTNTYAYRDATVAINAYNVALKEASVGSKILTTSMSYLSIGFKAVSMAATALIRIFSGLFMVGAILQLFGFDVFGSIVDWIKKGREETEQFKSGLLGAFTSAAGGASTFEQKLKSLGATTTEIEQTGENVAKVYAEIFKPVKNSVEAQATNFDYVNRQITQATEGLERYGIQREALIAQGRDTTRVDGFIEDMKAKLSINTTRRDDILSLGGMPSNLMLLEEVRKKIVEVRSTVTEAGGNSFANREDVLNLAYLEALEVVLTKYDRSVLSLAGSLAALSGISTEDIFSTIGTQLASVEQGTNTIKLFGVELTRLAGQNFNLDSLVGAEEYKKGILAAGLSAQSAMRVGLEDMFAGSSTADKLSSIIAGVRSGISAEVTKITEAYDKAGKSSAEAATAIKLFVDEATKGLDGMIEFRDALSAVEKTYKNISAAFSNEIALLDKLQVDGLVDSTGKVATTEAEISINKKNNLLLAIEANKLGKERAMQIAEMTAAEQTAIQDNLSLIYAQAEAYDISMKALAGGLVNANIELGKLIETESARVDELNTQLGIQFAQNEILIEQADNALKLSMIQNDLSAQERALDIASKLSDIDKTRLDYALQQANYLNDLVPTDAKLNSAFMATSNSQELQNNVMPSLQALALTLDSSALDTAVSNLEQVFLAGGNRQAAIYSVQIEATKAIQAQELRLFADETRLQMLKDTSEAEKIKQELNIITMQAEVLDRKYELEKTNIETAAKTQLANLIGYEMFVGAVDSLGSHFNYFAEIVNAYLTGTNSTSPLVDIKATKSLVDDVAAQLATARDLITTGRDSQLLALDDNKQKDIALQNTQVAQLRETYDALVKKIQQYVTLRGAEYDSLRVDQASELAGLENSLTKSYFEQANNLYEQSKSLDEIIIKQKEVSKELKLELFILKEQAEINAMSNEAELQNTLLSNKIANMEQELAISQQLLDNDKQRLAYALQQANYYDGLLTSKKEGSNNMSAAALSSELTDRVSPVLQQLAVSVNSDSLTAAVANLEKVFREGGNRTLAIAAVELEATRAIQAQELSILSDKKALAAEQAARDLLANTNAQIILKAETALETAKIAAQRAAIATEAALINAEIAAFTGFAAGVDGLSVAFSYFATIVNTLSSVLGTGNTVAVQNATNLAATVASQFTVATDLVTSNAADQNAILDAQLQAALTSAGAALAQLQAERSAIITKLNNDATLSDAERTALLLEHQMVLDNLNNKIVEANGNIEAMGGNLTGRFTDMQSSFASSIESALMGFNNLLFYGEGTIGEIIGGLFRSIQEEVFKETIAKPISNIISNWLSTAIGGLMDNKDVLGSSLAGSVGNNGVDLATNAMGAAAAAAGAGVAASLTGISGAIGASAPVASGAITTAGSTLASAMISLGSSVASAAAQAIAAMAISKGVGAVVTAVAGGGAIHRAGGGGIQHLAGGGNALRDRVPALLEPGEFVIRKPMAKRIGMSNLQSMNATGSTGMAAPVIIFKNEGSPKEAEASTPRFDGEKFVIDIITRDLSTNGPIRRSLRSGAI